MAKLVEAFVGEAGQDGEALTGSRPEPGDLPAQVLSGTWRALIADDEAGTTASMRRAADWVRQNLPEARMTIINGGGGGMDLIARSRARCIERR